MFNKNNQKRSKATRIDTLIGQYTHIKGDVSFSGGLRIDGSVAGNISATGDNKSVLTLSEKSVIEGEIRVPNLIVNGTIIGDVYSSQHVELAANTKINGTVYYRLLEMVTGCEVNGQLIHVAEDDEQIMQVKHDVLENKEDPLQLEKKDNLD